MDVSSTEPAAPVARPSQPARGRSPAPQLGFPNALREAQTAAAATIPVRATPEGRSPTGSQGMPVDREPPRPPTMAGPGSLPSHIERRDRHAEAAHTAAPASVASLPIQWASPAIATRDHSSGPTLRRPSDSSVADGGAPADRSAHFAGAPALGREPVHEPSFQSAVADQSEAGASDARLHATIPGQANPVRDVLVTAQADGSVVVKLGAAREGADSVARQLDDLRRRLAARGISVSGIHLLTEGLPDEGDFAEP